MGMEGIGSLLRSGSSLPHCCASWIYKVTGKYRYDASGEIIGPTIATDRIGLHLGIGF